MLYTAKIGRRKLITVKADSENEAKDKLSVMLRIKRLCYIHEQWLAAGEQLTEEK